MIILQTTVDLNSGDTIHRGRTGEVVGELRPDRKLGWTVVVRLDGERKCRKFWHKVVSCQADSDTRSYEGRDTPLIWPGKQSGQTRSRRTTLRKV